MTRNFVQEFAGLELRNKHLQSQLELNNKKLAEERAVSAKRDESIKALQKVHRSLATRHFFRSVLV